MLVEPERDQAVNTMITLHQVGRPGHLSFIQSPFKPLCAKFTRWHKWTTSWLRQPNILDSIFQVIQHFVCKHIFVLAGARFNSAVVLGTQKVNLERYGAWGKRAGQAWAFQLGFDFFNSRFPANFNGQKFSQARSVQVFQVQKPVLSTV